ncbi:MAG: patatin-like phospholipase family protein [Candidatus Omnitrophica bacterium]|nr:patatin-like phospholipase family protein [Candidatus Omnitrophota bacterium]
MNPFFNKRSEIIRNIPIFSKLNWFEVQKIAKKSELTEYKKGDIIVHAGDPPDYFSCLISGRLQAYTLNEHGRKENVDFIHRGAPFGIISSLTNEDHSLNFEAINDSVVLRIPNTDFQEIIKSIPQLAVDLSQNLSARIQKKYRGIHSNSQSNIISIFSPISDIGSSTYAVNLSYHLKKETKRKVILVHLFVDEESLRDPNPVVKASPQWMTPAKPFDQFYEQYDRIKEHVHRDERSFDVIHLLVDIHDPAVQRHISPLVSILAEDYHFVVIDLPNVVTEINTEIMTQSDYVHLITTDNEADLNTTREYIDQLEIRFREKFSEDRIRILIRSEQPKVFLTFDHINEMIDYPVYTMLPIIDQTELQYLEENAFIRFKRCHERSPFSKTITRIAREIGGVRVGVVLGGGAALGVAHIGVIRVLEEENIPVDVVVGSSMGALIGSIWTTGKDSVELEKVAREFENKADMLKLFDPVFPISGIIGGRLIKRWLKKHLGTRTFYSTLMPLKIVAYDITRREEIVIDGGSLVDAVRQSVAIPGVIEPVKQDRKVIIDGGVLNPLPTNVLADLGIRKIIAVNVLQSPEDVNQGEDYFAKERDKQYAIPFFKNPWHYVVFRLKRALGKMFSPNIPDIIVQTLQATEHVIAEQSSQLATVNIHPDLVGIKWFELNKVDDLIRAGEDAARKHLPDIKKMIEE